MANDALIVLWRERLAACSASGLSIQRWCELNGTTYRQYGYWRRRLARLPKASEAAAAPREWVVVSEQEQQPSAPCVLTVRIAGAQIDVAAGFDADLLRSVVAALGSQPC